MCSCDSFYLEYFQDSFMLCSYLCLPIIHCWICDILLISSVDGHLNYFHLLATVHTAAINTVYNFLCGCVFSVVLSINLGVILFGICNAFFGWGNVRLFSKVATPFDTPHQQCGESQSLHILLNVYYSSFKITAIPVGVKCYPLWFCFSFLWWLMMLNSSPGAYWPFV